MNTTIHSRQGQNKTKPLLEKQLLQPLFNPQAFGVFMQKSQNFPLQEAPGRKLVPWSSATPQTRENKGNAGIYSPAWRQHPRIGSRSTGERAGFPGRLRLEEPCTLHFGERAVGFQPHFYRGPIMKPVEDLNGIVGISYLSPHPNLPLSQFIGN